MIVKYPLKSSCKSTFALTQCTTTLLRQSIKMLYQNKTNNVGKPGKPDKPDRPDDPGNTELQERAALNNLHYDCWYFHKKYHRDLRIMGADPNYYSPFVTVVKRIHEVWGYEPNNLACTNPDESTAHLLKIHDFVPAEQEHDGGENPNNQDLDIHLLPEVLVRLAMMHIRIERGVCAICRLPTNNYIQDGCESGCRYYCHDNCAARWIIGCFDHPRPYCMICAVDHATNQIPRVMSDNGFIHVTRQMILDGLLDANNLGPQFMDYLDFRQIGVNQILPHVPIELIAAEQENEEDEEDAD